MPVLILTPRPGYPEAWNWAFDVEAEALAAAGIIVVGRPWTDPCDIAGFDLILPLVAWGYNLDYPRWLALLDRAQSEGWPMANPPALLRWNGDKAYLAELGAKGVATVPTIEVEALDSASLAAAAEQFAVADLVVKPPISGGAEGTYRLGAGDPIPADVAGRRMMVQPYQPSIAQGEYSLMLFGGVLSHCILKVPKPGDFRVQPHLGGTDRACAPPAGALDLARAALAAAPAAATYARVDMLVGDDGGLKIMELELIEPALFLHHAPDRGAAFASAVCAAASR